MDRSVFFDSNVLVYAFQDIPRKSEIARELLGSGGVIGVQTLNECANVFRRKLSRTLPEVQETLSVIQGRCPPPIELTLELHEEGLEIAFRHKLQVYDALIVAAALKARCETLFSEDLQHGRVFERQLTVRNPFC